MREELLAYQRDFYKNAKTVVNKVKGYVLVMKRCFKSTWISQDSKSAQNKMQKLKDVIIKKEIF
jgi:hypothetical protein